MVISDVEDIDALKELILSAKNGNKTAFERVYKLLYTPLYRYTLSRTKDKPLTEDIVQQVFLNFYKALSNYEVSSHPLAYLFTIAKNLMISNKEKDSRVSFDESIFENYISDDESDFDRLNTKLLASSIDNYIPYLTKDEQEVIRLYFYGEMEYREISKIMNKAEENIRKIKERALKKLRILTKHLYEQNQ